VTPSKLYAVTPLLKHLKNQYSTKLCDIFCLTAGHVTLQTCYYKTRWQQKKWQCQFETNSNNVLPNPKKWLQNHLMTLTTYKLLKNDKTIYFFGYFIQRLILHRHYIYNFVYILGNFVHQLIWSPWELGTLLHLVSTVGGKLCEWHSICLSACSLVLSKE
jgi:hypothetical protein